MKFYEKVYKAKTNKKGFTLVELIVVLVILAILAAILVPALTGYIDRANNQQVQLNARNALIAAQTIASEYYADGKDLTDSAVTAALITEAKTLGDVTGDITAVTIDTKGKITALTYSEGTGKTTIYHSAAGGQGANAYEAGWTKVA